MAWAKPPEDRSEKVMAAVLDEARANNALPEVIAAAMTQLRETDRQVAHVALRAMMEATAASLPAHKRRKFFGRVVRVLGDEIECCIWVEGGCDVVEGE